MSFLIGTSWTTWQARSTRSYRAEGKKPHLLSDYLQSDPMYCSAHLPLFDLLLFSSPHHLLVLLGCIQNPADKVLETHAHTHTDTLIYLNSEEAQQVVESLFPWYRKERLCSFSALVLLASECFSMKKTGYKLNLFQVRCVCVRVWCLGVWLVCLFYPCKCNKGGKQAKQLSRVCVCVIAWSVLFCV